MQAYASAERLTSGDQHPPIEPMSAVPLRAPRSSPASDNVLIDQLLGRLADLVVDRLTDRAAASGNRPADDWMDAREAAIHLGIHRDTLRKLAAQRAVPVHQDGPGCKLYFRRHELDDWRQSSGGPRRQLRVVS
jgi:excisionase family DNA binding protein